MELTVRLAMIILKLITKLLQPIYWFVNRHRPKQLPAIKNPLLLLSAKELAKKIRNREISSEAVVKAYIERIIAVNPQINAVIENRFNEATKEAKICDKNLDSGVVNIHTLEKEQPLYGVPFSVKEACALKGCSFTACTLSRKNEKAPEDGEAVKLMKLAGAIPLCVTNTPEMCSGFDSSNLIHGSTNNPYDTRRIAGGSSGGEGALGGAGATPLGIGSDIAGSIRLPCLFNGLFGHKATSGAVSIRGHYPMSPSPIFQNYLSTGPMTRYSEDLLIAMKILSKNYKENLRLDEPVDINKLKLFYMEKFPDSPGEIPVTHDIRNSIKKAVNFLKKRVASVDSPNMSELKDVYEISTAMFFCMADIPRILLNPDDPKNEKNPYIELGKALFGFSQHTKNAILMGIFKDTKGFLYESRLDYYRERAAKLQTAFENMLGTNGVLIVPTYPSPALLRNQSFLHIPGGSYCILFNIFGFPSTQVPMGLNEQGLPIGFQLIANKNQDRLCLAVAQELEKEFGGWIAPNSR